MTSRSDVNEFRCEVCGNPCTAWAADKRVTEPRCFEHASAAEQERRRTEQLTLETA